MDRTDTIRPATLMAARHAVTLGTSLAITAGLALLVRLLLPRFLGPSAFGELRLAESYAELLFVVLTFGVDSHLRREAAVDPARVARYVTGLTALRGLGGIAAVTLAVLALRLGGASVHLQLLVGLTGLSQVLLVLNNTYAALEHAAGDPGWIARTNIAVKVLWSLAVVTALVGHGGVLAIAWVALAVEFARFVWLLSRSERRHGLLTRLDVRLTIGAILASLPFFVNTVAHSLYARIGLGWLGAWAGREEAGLYSAAASLAAVALMGMPLLSWVLVPQTARAGAQGGEREANQLIAGALRVSLLAGVPLAAAAYVAAEPVMGLLFGAAFEPAAPVLRIMAPTVGLAYLSTVCAIALIQRGRTWLVAAISIAGVATTAALNAVLVPWGANALGIAGAAQGAAWAALGTETVVTIALAALSRSSWADPRLTRTAMALASGLAALGLVSVVLPATGLVPAMASWLSFAVTVVLVGGINRDDLAFWRSVLSRTPSEAS